MNHTLYYGVFAQNFENTFLDLLAKTLLPFDPVLVLTPNPLMGLYLKRRLALKTKGHSGVFFLTLEDVLKTNTQKNTVPKELEEVVVSSRLQDFKFNVFEKNDDLFDLISQSYSHWLTELKPHFKQAQSKKSLEIEKIFSFLSSDQKILLKSEAFYELTQKNITLSPNVKTLYIYGFQTLDQTQKKIITGLSKNYEINFFYALTDQPNVEVFQKNDFFSFFKKTEQIKPNLKKTNPVVVLSPSPRAQYLNAVREFLKQLNQNPSELHKVAFLFPNLSLATPLTHTLKRAGIPYYFSKDSELRETNLAQSLLTMLNCLKTNLLIKDVLMFFKSISVRPEILRSCLEPSDWERLFKNAQMVFLDSLSLEKLHQYKPKNALEEKIHLPLISLFTDILKSFEELEKGKGSFKNFCEAFKAFVIHYAAPDAAQEKILESLEKLEPYDSFLKSLNFSLKTFISVFEKKLLQQTLHDLKFEKSGVFVGTLTQASMMHFDHIFAFDFNSGLVPQQKKEPLLTQGFYFDPDTEKEKNELYFQVQKERFDFLSLSAQKSLSIYASKKNAQGKLLGVSPFIFDLPLSNLPLYPWEETTELYVDELDFAQTQKMGFSQTSEEQKKLDFFSPLSLPLRNFIQGRLSTSHFTPYDGVLLEQSKSVHTLRFSSGQIETFFSCPYKFHLEYNLNLKSEMDPDELSLKPIDKGSWVHGLLFDFFLKLRQLEFFPLNKEKKIRAHTLLDEIFMESSKKMERTFAIQNMALFEFEKNLILSDLHQLLDQENELSIPLAFEVRFGMSKREGSQEDPTYSTDQPFVLKHEGVSYELYGKIDRINQKGSHYEVVDYKTGKLKNEKNNDFAKGQSLQLPIYILATEHLFHAPQKVDAKKQSLYSFIKPIYFLNSNLHEKLSSFFSFLKVFHSFKQKGFFPPYPGKNMENCRWCDFKNICSPHIQNIFNKKQDDPTFASYLNLKEER